MAQTFFPITPVDVTPEDTGSWQDVSCAAHIAVGATGVILHIVNEDIGTNRIYSLRKKGSDDNRIAGIARRGAYYYGAIGVDANREFQAYIATTDVKIYLVGYTKSGVTFFTNAYDKSLSTTGSWQPISCSIEAPGAIGLVFEVYYTSSASYRNVGLRKMGSDDNRVEDSGYHAWCIVGCDASQEIEGYIENGVIDFYLVGYITDGVVLKANADDKSLTKTGSYQDIDCEVEAPEAVMFFFEVVLSGSPYTYALRKDDTRPDIYRDCPYHGWAMVECDGNQHCEGKRASIAIDFFLMGYATKPIAGWTGKISGVTNPAKIMGVDVANIAKVKGVA